MTKQVKQTNLPQAFLKGVLSPRKEQEMPSIGELKGRPAVAKEIDAVLFPLLCLPRKDHKEFSSGGGYFFGGKYSKTVAYGETDTGGDRLTIEITSYKNDKDLSATVQWDRKQAEPEMHSGKPGAGIPYPTGETIYLYTQHVSSKTVTSLNGIMRALGEWVKDVAPERVDELLAEPAQTSTVRKPKM